MKMYTHPCLPHRCCTEINMTIIKNVLSLAAFSSSFCWFIYFKSTGTDNIWVPGKIPHTVFQSVVVSVNKYSSEHMLLPSIWILFWQACKKSCKKVFPIQCQQSRAKGTERIDNNEGIDDGIKNSHLYDSVLNLIVRVTGINTARVSTKDNSRTNHPYSRFHWLKSFSNMKHIECIH